MDRHSFSEPRPVSNNNDDFPTWQVDVFREGVEEPISTLIINKTTLPPRMRKKRVVWKLPDNIDEKPNFGSDEKKRMLELFKKQKKSRKKQSKRNSMNSNHGNEEQAITTQVEQEQPQQEPQNGGKQTEEEEEPEVILLEEQEQHSFSFTSNGHVPPGFSAVNETNGDPQVHDNLDTNGHSSASHTPIPPPGFANLSLQDTDNDQVQPQPLQEQTTTSSSPLSTQSRYFTVPITSSTNIPVDLAKIVVDIYYPFMTLGHFHELLAHFSSDASKSLSVGGAHAVCCTRQDFLLQFASLQYFDFLVKGVVAQPGIEDSVVLLITGTVVQNTTPKTQMPFCHSLTCIRASLGEFQIHNDAMALLTE